MEVREILCKQALVKSGISDFALNPYTGCMHGCVYCYASFMTRFSHHKEPWGRWVDVKVNVQDVLEKDLRRLDRRQRLGLFRSSLLVSSPENEKRGPRDPDEPLEVVVSSVTDAYQPLENRYQVTRHCLSTLAKSKDRLRISVLTKSSLVMRDIDVLKDLSDVEIGMTITTTDDAVSKRYEPGASPVTERLRALEALSDAGFNTWAFVAPILPYHSDSVPAMTQLLRSLREKGVSRIMADRFNPYPASCGKFIRAAPSEAVQVLRQYRTNPKEYLARLKETIAEAAQTGGVDVQVLF